LQSVSTSFDEIIYLCEIVKVEKGGAREDFTCRGGLLTFLLLLSAGRR